MNAYLAGSIFYYGDVLRNREWAAKIREAIPGINLYSPIENTEINGAEGKKKSAGSIKIVEADNARLRNTDVLIACIDGDVIPSGTCAEVGYMSALIENGAKKLIIGICTDNRQCFLTHSEEKDAAGAAAPGEQQYSYQNLYVTGLINKFGVLTTNIDDAIDVLRMYAGWIRIKDPAPTPSPTDLREALDFAQHGTSTDCHVARGGGVKRDKEGDMIYDEEWVDPKGVD